MPTIKFSPVSESKLSKTITRISQEIDKEKQGFIKSQADSKNFFNTKSFRLREQDIINLSYIVEQMNVKNSRKNFTTSKVIRGLIDYVSCDFEVHYKKLCKHIKDSQ